LSAPRFFPDFFVVGAPRCGTTSLCRYLSQHPAICFSRPKEPHYFSRLAPGDPASDLETAYLRRCFGHRGPQHLRAGEGSVSYLYSPQAIERILSLEPRARFIVMLRDPLEMLPSYHLRLLFLLEEDEEDFATAWRLQAARARGEGLPKRCREPSFLQYAEIGSLGTWLERLWLRAGPRQVLPVVFDDFAADTAKEYERVLRFLDLEPDGQAVFWRKQRSRFYRSRRLQALLHRPPPALAKLAGVDAAPASSAAAGSRSAGRAGRPGVGARWLRAGARRAGPALVRVRERLVRWNSIDASPRPLSPELRRELRAAFAGEIRKLSELLGRDLGHWG
jgi:hypothetical protein